jgi:hypothetical protein
MVFLSGLDETANLFQTQMLPSFLEASVLDGEAEGRKQRPVFTTCP